jgi:hypothetical protein
MPLQEPMKSRSPATAGVCASQPPASNFHKTLGSEVVLCGASASFETAESIAAIATAPIEIRMLIEPLWF